MNPCPCGFLGDSARACTCTDATVARYRKRLSGPLLDRIDIHLDVPRVPYDKLAAGSVAGPVGCDAGAAEGSAAAAGSGERSAVVRARVVAARERQQQRLAGTPLRCNAELGPAEVRRHCRLEPDAEALVRAAMQRLHLSARAYHRVLKLARTVADLAGAETIGTPYVAEALQYRPREQE
jgi:magnesium chelatase family protein